MYSLYSIQCTMYRELSPHLKKGKASKEHYYNPFYGALEGTALTFDIFFLPFFTILVSLR